MIPLTTTQVKALHLDPSVTWGIDPVGFRLERFEGSQAQFEDELLASLIECRNLMKPSAYVNPGYMAGIQRALSAIQKATGAK